jgi:hypothetical protein
MKYKYGFGISLPNEIVKKIDTDRGDVPRSKHLLRILERKYGTVHVNKNNKVEQDQTQDELDLNVIESPKDQANSEGFRS